MTDTELIDALFEAIKANAVASQKTAELSPSGAATEFATAAKELAQAAQALGVGAMR
jgi:hypothetical protein